MSSGQSESKGRVARHGLELDIRRFVSAVIDEPFAPSPLAFLRLGCLQTFLPQDCCACDCDADATYSCGELGVLPYNCLHPTSACGKKNGTPASRTIPAAWSARYKFNSHSMSPVACHRSPNVDEPSGTHCFHSKRSSSTKAYFSHGGSGFLKVHPKTPGKNLFKMQLSMDRIFKQYRFLQSLGSLN